MIVISVEIRIPIHQHCIDTNENTKTTKTFVVRISANNTAIDSQPGKLLQVTRKRILIKTTLCGILSLARAVERNLEVRKV
ncbi:hypothetical protein PMAYCL1PPCAC_08621 [Pristionchus mayeri]|uniref:Uncharacterized protein n=1 Tax=Pristionchus mayeri TaxID=1317129 RepID=A0AAN4ZG38_9BILA|nr:hypothetical protein PMAYCL1PPCAC_08621 [Pristionchus mayeri]